MNKLTQVFPVILTLAFLAVFPFTSESFAQPVFNVWEVSEFQPNIPQGGRANTIAVHPTDVNKMYVASESGGLFRSVDRAVYWRHVDNLPCFATMSVAYLPANPDIVLVTTLDDYKTISGGGIWRSTDGGLSWAQMPVTIPAGITTGRLSAYDISIAPDSGHIFVASDYGVLKSTDRGASWAYKDVFGGGDRQVFSVTALDSLHILAGGEAGIRRSEDGGSTWLSPVTGVGYIKYRDIHALGRSPVWSSQAFAVGNERIESYEVPSLYYTEDAGQNWTKITSAPGGGGACGGIDFARPVDRTDTSGQQIRRQLDLFYGNRCNVSKLRIPFDTAAARFVYTGSWQEIGADHGDTRDIGFEPGLRPNPVLLATDGGLHITTDGGAHWIFSGGGRNGYNALQITEVQGQLIENIGRYDLYFATQDNSIWASGDDGISWPLNVCCEGFFIEGEKKVSNASDSVFTFVACGECSNHVSNSLLRNDTGWRNPPGRVAGNPMLIKSPLRIQGVENSEGFSRGMTVTSDLGLSWRQYAVFPEEHRSIPKLGRVGSTTLSTEVYQAYRAGWDSPNGLEINKLLRLSQLPGNSAAEVVYPAMNNFGGLGINRTEFAWYQVYAVDPGDYQHIIAPDIINNRMMQTRDGGENWTEIWGLTNLVTDRGNLRFSARINRWVFPLVSAISFSPQNPNTVIAGTLEGGLYLSTDNGDHWERLANSEGVTYVTGFAWKDAGDVVISTYGRGLWRMKGYFRIFPVDLEVLCYGCLIAPWEKISDPAEKVSFDRGILVYEGRILGARIARGILKEVFVSHGSSVIFAYENKEASDIKVTRTNKYLGFAGIKTVPKAPLKAPLMKGLVFDAGNHLKGAIFGDKPMMMYEVKKDDKQDKKQNTKSPIEGKPYIRLAAKGYAGVPTARAG